MTNSLALLIQHPSIDSTAVSTTLGVEPSYTRAAGAPIVTLDGTETGGHYKWTAWSLEVDHGSGETMGALRQILSLVEKRDSSLRELTSTGGRVSLTVRADMNEHFVVALTQGDLARLASREIQIGFEAFPVR